MHKKFNLSSLLKGIISFGLLIFLIVKMDLATVGDILLKLHPGFYAAVVILLFGEVLLMALRTKSILETKNLNVPLWVLLKLNLISVFVGIFLPSKLGMDMLRVYYINKHTDGVSDSISTVAVDRVLNIVVMTLFAMVCYFWGGYMDRLPDLLWVFVPFGAGILVFLAMLLPAVQYQTKQILSRFKWSGPIRDTLISMADSMRALIADPVHFLKLLFYILLFQTVRISVSYYFCRALHIDIPYFFLFVVVPMQTMLGMLPVSIAGLGIEQGSTVFFFGLVGISMEEAFGFSILVFFTRIAVTLPGLYFFHKEGLGQIMESISRRRGGMNRRAGASD